MKTQKHVTKSLGELFKDFPFKYHVNYDTRTSLHGEYEQIEEVIIKSVDVALILKAFAFQAAKIKDHVLAYCVDRILSHDDELKSRQNWVPTIKGGYYGQQVERIVPASLDLLAKKLDTLEILPNSNARLEFVLKNEYGFLL